LASIDQSLRRLDMDYVDLYQVHGWDLLPRLRRRCARSTIWFVREKVRYIGCSNWAARQLMKSLVLSEANGWAQFVSLQAYYSLGWP
jgi:aryl-alcohol dehydrogenase-like predicted oxidoreductase